MTHAPQLSSIYARALYASQMIAIHHRAAGGTLTAIMSLINEPTFSLLFPPELRGVWCSSGLGCPEGVLPHRWRRGHVGHVVVVECFHGSSNCRPHTLQPQVEWIWKSLQKCPAEKGVVSSCLSLVAPLRFFVLLQLKLSNCMYSLWKGHYSHMC